MPTHAQKIISLLRLHPWLFLACALVALLYLCGLCSDSLSGLFGVMGDDEGAYILSAKNAVLFGQAHFFAGDRWLPELLAPALHHFALLTLTPSLTNPLFGLHLAMALMVLTGSKIIASLIYLDSRKISYALIAFLFIAINPVIFFYARVGLSEGIQYFILALLLASIYQLCTATQRKRAVLCAAFSGALIASLFIAKISAAPACIALTLGSMLAIHGNIVLNRKFSLHAIFVAAMAACLALYFGIGLHGQLPDWWRVNITDQVMHRMPFNASIALAVFGVKLTDIAYYFTLLPIMAFYFAALLIAVQKEGFVFILGVITIGVIFLESFFGGEIRRNFFSLAMLGITFSFVALDYLRSGILVIRKGNNPAIAAAILIMAAHGWGIVHLLYGSIKLEEPRYIAACLIFIAFMVAIALSAKPARYKLRYAIVGSALLCALFPMVTQSFFSPYTRQNAAARIDAFTPEDTIIAGHSAAFFFPSLKRRVILTNCVARKWQAHYANDMSALPAARSQGYIGAADALEKDECKPEDAKAYSIRDTVTIFNPTNFGGPRSVSERIVSHYRFSYYAK